MEPVTSEDAVEVVGIVRNVGGRAVGNDGRWQLRITLYPWRTVAGSIEPDGLRVVSPPTSKSGMDDEWGRVRGRKIVRAVVRLDGTTFGDARNAERMSELTIEREDTELVAVRAELAKPYAFEIEGLGTLRMDRRSRQRFVATVKLGAREARLSVPRAEFADEVSRDRARLEEAAPRVALIQARWPIIAEAIVAEMYPVYADHWADGPPVSRDAFRELLAPSELAISPDRTSLYVLVGPLFTDHAVHVRLDRGGQITEMGL